MGEITGTARLHSGVIETVRADLAAADYVDSLGCHGSQPSAKLPT